MPMHWWPNPESVGTIIEAEGPWPSPSPQSIGTFLPLDVDRYDGLAVVIGYGKNRHGKDVLGTDEFQLLEDGSWLHLSGGGGGHQFDLRDHLEEAKDALHWRMGGSSGQGHLPLEFRRPSLSFAVFVCGPEVATVKVERRHGIRTADVSAGPGWLVVLWTPTDLAAVSAYAENGLQTFHWQAT